MFHGGSITPPEGASAFDEAAGVGEGGAGCYGDVDAFGEGVDRGCRGVGLVHEHSGQRVDPD